VTASPGLTSGLPADRHTLYRSGRCNPAQGSISGAKRDMNPSLKVLKRGPAFHSTVLSWRPVKQRPQTTNRGCAKRRTGRASAGTSAALGYFPMVPNVAPWGSAMIAKWPMPGTAIGPMMMRPPSRLALATLFAQFPTFQ